MRRRCAGSSRSAASLAAAGRRRPAARAFRPTPTACPGPASRAGSATPPARPARRADLTPATAAACRSSGVSVHGRRLFRRARPAPASRRAAFAPPAASSTARAARCRHVGHGAGRTACSASTGACSARRPPALGHATRPGQRVDSATAALHRHRLQQPGGAQRLELQRRPRPGLAALRPTRFASAGCSAAARTSTTSSATCG